MGERCQIFGWEFGIMIRYVLGWLGQGLEQRMEEVVWKRLVVKNMIVKLIWLQTQSLACWIHSHWLQSSWHLAWEKWLGHSHLVAFSHWVFLMSPDHAPPVDVVCFILFLITLHTPFGWGCKPMAYYAPQPCVFMVIYMSILLYVFKLFYLVSLSPSPIFLFHFPWSFLK